MCAPTGFAMSAPACKSSLFLAGANASCAAATRSIESKHVVAAPRRWTRIVYAQRVTSTVRFNSTQPINNGRLLLRRSHRRRRGAGDPPGGGARARDRRRGLPLRVRVHARPGVLHQPPHPRQGQARDVRLEHRVEDDPVQRDQGVLCRDGGRAGLGRRARALALRLVGRRLQRGADDAVAVLHPLVQEGRRRPLRAAAPAQRQDLQPVEHRRRRGGAAARRGRWHDEQDDGHARRRRARHRPDRRAGAAARGPAGAAARRGGRHGVQVRPRHVRAHLEPHAGDRRQGDDGQVRALHVVPVVVHQGVRRADARRLPRPRLRAQAVERHRPRRGEPLRDGPPRLGHRHHGRPAVRAPRNSGRAIRPRNSSNGAALASTTGTSPTASSARTRRRRRRRRTARGRRSRRSEPSWSGSRATAGRSTPTKRTGCSTRTSGCCRGARRWRWRSKRRATRSSSRRSGWS